MKKKFVFIDSFFRVLIKMFLAAGEGNDIEFVPGHIIHSPNREGIV